MRKLIDLKRILVRSGAGGDGAISFERTVYQPMGPPSGGNGGVGASVYITASHTQTSLGGLLKRYHGKNGAGGENKNQHGANAKHIEILVPIGTMLREVAIETPQKMNFYEQIVDRETTDTKDQARVQNEVDQNDVDPTSTKNDTVLKGTQKDEVLKNNESEKNSEDSTDIQEDELDRVNRHFKFRSKYVPQEDRLQMLLERIPPTKATADPLVIDFVTEGQRHLICSGGAGGLGNPHFASPLIPGPGIAQRGDPSTTKIIQLELKILADAGLVGLPNAGKSTLLKSLTNALPLIAPYPFTTLDPYIGVISHTDYWEMTVADIPGLIQGAHANKGLGHKFLRHIERTKMLVYVLDLSRTPYQDFLVLQDELERYLPGICQRPSVIAGNKADLAASEQNLKELGKMTSIPIVPVSAMMEKNIGMLSAVMRSIIEKIRL